MLANRINRVRIKNYRSLADVDMTFEDLTVLVGPNGSGKSNVVDALRFVRDALTQGVDLALDSNYRDGLGSVLRYSTDVLIQEFAITLDLVINDQPASYGFIISEVNELDRYSGFVKEEFCSIGKNNFHRATGRVTSISEDWRVYSNRNQSTVPVNELILKNLSFWIESPDLTALLQILLKGGFYSMSPSTFRSPQPKSKAYPLDEDGGNLVSVLNDFVVSNNEWLPDLTESLALVVPELRSEGTITTQDAGGYLIIRLHHKDDSEFVLGHESDGTLRVLGILTALYQNPPLPLTVIEEPELGIHPHAIGVLADVLVEASHRTQLLLTTHSPDLISRVAPESLRLVERDEKDGSTKIGKVTSANIASVEEKLFSNGDLLRIGALRRDR